jgi:hypothetical protein
MGPPTPALLTSGVTVPSFACTIAMACATPNWSVTSTGKAMARPPEQMIVSAVA